ncbi:MAG TPA: methylenetetrahydrofolate--tRNA-(uracil(54)-C(5))-methyltransferase (FADH(2)-oxidizing) TrmFO [Paludibaculum sp.]
MKKKLTIHVLGAGLAGSEAAWQIARAGLPCVLSEMRPLRSTEAHQTADFAELVCSNSLKSDSENSAPWLLKHELRRLGSLAMEVAERARVPGGQALTVDRGLFARGITAALEAEPLMEIRREEITCVPDEGIVVVATGPLTSGPLAEDIARLTGSGGLYFYDSISPIVDAETIDRDKVFAASRYGKSIDGSDDYLNCPFNREEYEAFVDAILTAESAAAHIEADRAIHGGKVAFFESCLPVEELARRGRETLRFGPMKPVGLDDPKTGRWPYAVIQLRQEDQRAGSYNLVGFQNYMKFPEQKRVFRMIPGLENAEFLRYGQIHRNTYINGPELLSETLSLKSDPRVLFAGQISGVEGYVESIATGLLAGRHAAALAMENEPRPLPRETALGSLTHFITHANPKNYQPANIAFDLLPALDEETRKKLKRDKRARHAEVCRRAIEAMNSYV